MPNLTSDIAIHGNDGRLVAAVEVKNRAELPPAIATALRRNLVSHGAITSVPYFMLVSQDRGFLWLDKGEDDLEAAPSLEFSMKPVLARYLPRRFKGRLRDQELEWVVYSWLTDLREGDAPPTLDPDRALAASGFIEAIRGGSVARQIA